MHNPVRNIRVDAVAQAYQDRGLDRLSDVQLLEFVIEICSRPKQKTTSYSLHIGMETMARFILFSRMPSTEHRTWARMQFVGMAATYEALGEDIPAPKLPAMFQDPEHHLALLLDAIDAGDADAADVQATILGRISTAGQIAGPFADRTMHGLGAAGHAPIFLSLARKVGLLAPTLAMLPNVARGLAEEIDKQAWFTAPLSDTAQSASADEIDMPSIRDAFCRGLLEAPRVGPAKDRGIAGVVLHAAHHPSRADAMEQAFELLARVAPNGPSNFEWHAAMSGLIGGAARLMLDEDIEFAKYYWTHCLTIPEGIWAIGPLIDDRRKALRVAASMALGFRSSLGRNDVACELQLPPVDMPLAEALIAGSREAAAVAYHAPAEAFSEMREHLCIEASKRNDAHLVKYTLQCLDCAVMDPGHAPLFHAAAAYLVSIWVREIPEEQLHEHLHSTTRAQF
jgi:hypothetical protein